MRNFFLVSSRSRFNNKCIMSNETPAFRSGMGRSVSRINRGIVNTCRGGTDIGRGAIKSSRILMNNKSRMLGGRGCSNSRNGNSLRSGSRRSINSKGK